MACGAVRVRSCAKFTGSDVDLAVTPATNTLAIRRLSLQVGSSVSGIAAWIKFPELTVQLLSQRYTRLAQNTYRYESNTGFSAEIVLDDLGLVTAYPGWLGTHRLAVESNPVNLSSYFAYQSECADQREHERHCVEVHWWRQAGHTPPVSNVFHSFPQLQDHRSSLRGDQPQSGQRMRGPDGSRLFSFSR